MATAHRTAKHHGQSLRYNFVCIKSDAEFLVLVVQELSSQKAEGSAQEDSYRAQLAEAHAANDVLHRQLEALEQEHRQLQKWVHE